MTVEILFMALIILPFGRLKKGLQGKKEPWETVSTACFWSLIGIVLIFALTGLITGGVGAAVEREIIAASKAISRSSQMTEALGFGELSQKERFEKIWELYKGISYIFPAVLVIAGSVTCFFEYNIFVSIFTKGEKRPYAKLADIRPNINQIAGWIVIYVLCLGVKFLGVEPGQQAVVNVDLILNSIFQLYGISFLFFMTEKKNIPKPLIVILTVFMIGLPPGRMTLYIIGIMELLFGLRKRIE